MGISRILKYSLVVLSLLCTLSLNAQSGGRRIHTVKAGETVYGISKQYGIKEAALLKFNPQIKEEGLKEGALILIPDSKSLERVAVEVGETRNDSLKFHYHTVKAGETLFSLAKQYGVTMIDIENANILGLKEGLKRGMTIKIPRKEYLEKKRQQRIEKVLNADPDAETNFDEDWLYHKVAEGQTAYALSKQYQISLDSLYLLNSSAEYGLRIGQWLKLPLNRKSMVAAKSRSMRPKALNTGAAKKDQPKEKAPEEVVVQEEENQTPIVEGAKGNSKFFLYKVKDGDTFFSLKERYQVSEEELKELNPELKNGLIQGRYVIMPKRKESKEINWLEKILKENEQLANEEIDTSGEETRKDFPKKPAKEKASKGRNDTLAHDPDKEFGIAVVLPFRAEIYADTLDYRNFNPHRDSEMSMQFYLGLLKAADSLQAQGMRLRLRVYDTEGKSNRLQSIAKDIEENQMDLVFGPAYKSNVDLLSANLEGVPIVSPLSMAVNVDQKPNLVQMIPNETARNKWIAELINNQYPNSKLIFAHCGTESENRQAQAIKAYLNPREADFIDKIVDCEELQNSRTLSIGAPDTVAKLVILLSNKPVFSTDLVSKLYNLKDSNIVLVGSPRLLNMQTMELRYLNALNFTTYEVRSPNYKEEQTQRLVEEFRGAYKADAGPFALQGFDAGMYFLSGLWSHGPNLLERLQPSVQRSTGFDFERKAEGGLENQYFFLTQMRDFQMHRLD